MVLGTAVTFVRDDNGSWTCNGAASDATLKIEGDSGLLMATCSGVSSSTDKFIVTLEAYNFELNPGEYMDRTKGDIYSSDNTVGPIGSCDYPYSIKSLSTSTKATISCDVK